MSRGAHRKPRPTTSRLRRTLAGLSLAAASVTGTILAATDTIAAPAADTAWGAPDTDPVVDTGTIVDLDVTVDVPIATPLDTAWG